LGDALVENLLHGQGNNHGLLAAKEAAYFRHGISPKSPTLAKEARMGHPPELGHPALQIKYTDSSFAALA
jgi:hypothetical protein